MFMMIPPEKLESKKLAKLLIDKHHKFLNEYRKEFDLLDRLIVLRERQEQLDYWIESTRYEDTKKYRKYLKQKKITDKEISELKKKINDITPNTSISEKRHEFLLTAIKNHRLALDYWNRVYKEPRKDSNERKGIKE
ncbi:MAG TPA: hypothetical protein EYP86_05080 [Candidatus Altiarchaeales archaeon]|nr:hypothetical protein [Candidatus Altiarchaeales archaeon]